MLYATKTQVVSAVIGCDRAANAAVLVRLVWFRPGV